MKQADNKSEFLREIQGIVLLIYHNRRQRISVGELLRIDKSIYEDLVQELNNSDPNTLKKCIRNAELIPEETLMSMKIDAYKRLGYDQNKIDERLKAETPSLELPSEFQNKETYKVLYSLLDILLPAVKELGYAIDEMPVFGSCQTFHFNAMAIGADRNSVPIVMFEDEAFLCCHLIAKTIANCLGDSNDNISIDYDNVIRQLNKYPQIESKFIELLKQTKKGITFSGIQPFPFISKDLLPFAGIITDSMEYFLLGHELGHIIKGHVNTSSIQNMTSSGLFFHNPSWEKELEADQIGLEIALKSMEREGKPEKFHFMGIVSMFMYWHIIDEYRAMLKGDDKVYYSKTSSHPPPMMRLERLEEQYMSITNNDLGLAIARNAGQILVELWKRNIPVLITNK